MIEPCMQMTKILYYLEVSSNSYCNVAAKQWILVRTKVSYGMNHYRITLSYQSSQNSSIMTCINQDSNIFLFDLSFSSSVRIWQKSGNLHFTQKKKKAYRDIVYQYYFTRCIYSEGTLWIFSVTIIKKIQSGSSMLSYSYS